MILLAGAIAAALLVAPAASAQVWQEWEARYDGPASGADGGHRLAVDSAGNVYVTGQSAGVNTADDYATVKYDSSGSQLWEARYNGPGDGYDRAYALVVDDAGNVYVTGTSQGYIESHLDYLTIKYDTSGNPLWVARYNGPLSGEDVAYAIALDRWGNVHVTGRSLGAGPPASWDYVTVKYGPAGNQIWVARYNGPANNSDTAYALAVDDDGNVYVGGGSTGISTVEDYATVKYNAVGSQLWVARYAGTGNSADCIRGLAVDAGGNVYVTGSSYGWPTWEDYVTIKYNPQGAQSWLDRYDANGNDDWGHAIALDEAGNVYVTGHSKLEGSGPAHDYVTIKYNNQGSRRWVARYDGPASGDEHAWALALDQYGDVYVTGTSPGTGTLNDYATVKYDTYGNELWVERYNGSGNGDDAASALVVDGDGNVYVTGQSAGAGTGGDYLTLKYTQPDPASVLVTPVAIGSSLRILANPSSGSTGLSFSLEAAQQVRVAVYDAEGRIVRTLLEGAIPAGVHALTWDGRGVDAEPVASGVYFCVVEARAAVMRQKMVMLR
jgi:uncharacterized delta-60 repeat protein